MHDIENSLRAENLIIVHLIASTVALVLAAACASRLRKAVTHPAFVVASGLVAAAGTLFSRCPSTPCAPTSAPSTPNSACTPAKSSATSSATTRQVNETRGRVRSGAFFKQLVLLHKLYSLFCTKSSSCFAQVLIVVLHKA